MKGITLVTIWLSAVYVECYIVNPGPKYVATKGAIWPKPQNQSVSDAYYVLTPRTFKFVANGATCDLLNNAFQRYFKILQKNTLREKVSKKKPTAPTIDENYLGVLEQLTVNLESCDDSAYPTLEMDETYVLSVTDKVANLTSATQWGILRGLESFSQLPYLGVDGSTVRVNATLVVDYPRFKHRGLLLDTGRHYIPIEQIHQIIDGLAYNKMNVLHWHMVDDQSFPFVSRVFPELSQLGAYDPELFIYTPDNVQEIIEYARQRGIRVMPEFDSPGHTRSWGVSHPELLTECGSIEEGAYGPIDPTKNTTYSFFNDLLTEVRSVFKDKFIHLGGDEVDFDCWEQDANINKFMEDHKLPNYTDLEGYYIKKIIDTADKLEFSSIVWEEVFRNGVDLPDNTIVHVWRDFNETLWNVTMNNVTKVGKTGLLSACWYLDHLSTGGDWISFYECEPTNFNGTAEQTKLVLGGEACMWSETVNEYNIVQRIWPRASAPAEKLWSAYDDDYDLDEVAERLEEHTCRLNRRGIPAQPPSGAGFCL